MVASRLLLRLLNNLHVCKLVIRYVKQTEVFTHVTLVNGWFV